ncbi:MAG: hypothetical protein COV74_04430 [Candidatus Omnitrophica bacterium CG11_big_fil_rev_8_21_14_0_20_45_26]|uniref:Purine nucleoside phosphorylase n=1 Tax=Candidatus Abzuiibacterium crystallinum TaxID=1974748 RepID=A0A2H0LQ81_9BACT|nr:MAG: hypothetical protein COV74_04430 [Candidatus Omnitrophica bacterium CG11_big_fil_rev_8_21_14_0_20_45_26]PIW64275.1 MAG: peptidoglycan editing factor PgeF [Candidatus Omnitrophica bacterium CG12_big_fil_rev_8_21_14_0_65_45_16]
MSQSPFLKTISPHLKNHNGCLIFRTSLDDHVLAGITTKQVTGGSDFSSGEAALQKESRLLSGLGLPGALLVRFQQVHGCEVKNISERPHPNQISHEKADGSMTSLPRLALGILTADCAPVFFLHPRSRTIGIAHAGWRGARAGIMEVMLKKYVHHFKIPVAEIEVLIGPCIRQAHYEVGQEFESFFGGHVARKDGQYFFDLPGWIAGELARLGVRRGQILDCGLCTYEQSDRFYSHRREGAAAGRMLSFIIALS